MMHPATNELVFGIFSNNVAVNALVTSGVHMRMVHDEDLF